MAIVILKGQFISPGGKWSWSQYSSSPTPEAGFRSPVFAVIFFIESLLNKLSIWASHCSGGFMSFNSFNPDSSITLRDS